MTRQARLPDGTTLSFPDGTADAVIDRTVKQHIGAKPAGVLDRVTGAVKAVGDVVNDSGELALSKLSMGISDRVKAAASAIVSGRSYGDAQAEVDQKKAAFKEAHPVFDWATLPLNLMGGGPALAEKIAAKFGGGLMGRAAGTGAAYGAAAGVGNARGSAGEQAKQVIGSTLFGAAAGPIAAKTVPWLVGASQRAAKPAVQKAGSLLRRYQSPAEGAVEEGIQNAPDPQPAVRKIIQKTLASQGMTPRQAVQMLDAARVRGVPMALMDTGDEMRGLASALARKPGASRTIMRDAMIGRQEEQGGRVQDAINRDLGPTVGLETQARELTQNAKATAGPIYEESFEGGSMAPLEHQFQQAFEASSGDVAAARRSVSDAQNALTQGAAAVSRAGENVYSSSAALRQNGGAVAALKKAQDNLVRATAAHEGNLARLRQAQADGSAQAPGAVWSPRIQQFLDDPIVKSGLAQGVEVQRLEALADGRHFNPTEHAITGMDAAGNPIVSAVPNMRTLHTVKLGLDSIIDKYPRDIAGNVILDQRGRAIVQVKKALLKEMDSLNPTYGVARSKYAGPVQDRAALLSGKSALNKSADEIQNMTRDLSESEKESFKLGLRSAASDAMEAKGDYADKARALVGSPKKRKALSALFGDQESLENFFATLADEQALASTYARGAAGSPTAPNLADDAPLDGAGGIVLNMGKRALQGWGIIGNALETAGDAFRYGSGKTGEMVRAQLASGLSETDPVVLAAQLRAVHNANLQNRIGRYKSLKRAPKVGAGAGLLSGRLVSGDGN